MVQVLLNKKKRVSLVSKNETFIYNSYLIYFIVLYFITLLDCAVFIILGLGWAWGTNSVLYFKLSTYLPQGERLEHRNAICRGVINNHNRHFSTSRKFNNNINVKKDNGSVVLEGSATPPPSD